MNIANSDANASSTLDPDSETLSKQAQLRVVDSTASRLAEDIENAIAPVALYSIALLESESLSERGRHYLSSIRRAADDATQIATRLRELLRPLERRSETADTRRELAPLLSPRSLRVLLIDDDPSLIEVLRSSLIDEGHKVSTANGGQAGIDTFRAARSGGMPFDIVITDLAMPDVDGRQVVASLRAISPCTPIILLTGWGQHVSNENERLPQVDRLLGKPPRMRELRSALAELTERRTRTRLA